MKTLEERFWEKVDKNGPVPAHRPELGPCWVWVGCVNADGYGRFAVERRAVNASRVSLWLATGKWPAHCALHHCDNPPCVNPTHLYDGTKRDNAQDRAERKPNSWATGSRSGRHTRPEATARGERHGNAKLTEVDVWCIRNALSVGKATAKELAEAFDITTVTIYSVQHGNVYAEAGGPILPRTPYEGDRHHMRRSEFRPNGEKNIKAKLTEEMVRQIRREHKEEGANYLILAARYGVDKGTIGHLVRRETWQHVEG